ncbi:MAG: endolytic transglycosylase MltG [Proteobacteria bacterium]|nr:endolytic transglycosylase MltG [Pseudomonadota bacterium]
MLKRSAINIYTLISLAIFALLLAIISLTIYLNLPNPHLQEDRYFVVEKGHGFKWVAKKLHNENIIKHPNLFLYSALLLKGHNLTAHQGEYLIEKNSSLQDIMDKIHKGTVHLRRITIAEGLSTHSILKIIDQAPYLTGEIDQNIAEGSMLPETYLYYRGESKMDVVKRMQDALKEVLDELWEKRDRSIPIKSKEEAIILASIVEKETGVPHERPMIASVFTNRLRTGMRLQSDPTIIYSYAFGNTDLEREIRRSDIRNKSNINTYHIRGLPPTPICNPGIDSIKAVLNPPESEYLYFVATGNGGHNFSSNIRDHNNFVTEYRKIIKEQNGN